MIGVGSFLAATLGVGSIVFVVIKRKQAAGDTEADERILRPKDQRWRDRWH